MKILILSLCFAILIAMCMAVRNCSTIQSRLANTDGDTNIGWWGRKRRSIGCNVEPTPGLYFSTEALVPNASLTMAGFLFNDPYDTGLTSNDTEECDINNHPFHTCTSQSPIEKRACFSNENQILNYANDQFGTQNIEIWRQERSNSTVLSSETYLVTVISVTPILGCDGKPLACHQVHGQNRCKLYVCHAISNTKAYLMVVNNEQIGTRRMIGICHYQTDDFNGNHEAFKVLHKKPGDTICHFVFQSGFILCPEE